MVRAFCVASLPKAPVWNREAVILVSLSIVSLLVFGLNLGIDFKGGSAVIVAFKSDGGIERAQIETAIHELVVAETGELIISVRSDT